MDHRSRGRRTGWRRRTALKIPVLQIKRPPRVFAASAAAIAVAMTAHPVKEQSHHLLLSNRKGLTGCGSRAGVAAGQARASSVRLKWLRQRRPSYGCETVMMMVKSFRVDFDIDVNAGTKVLMSVWL